jgi:hypothetical protein
LLGATSARACCYDSDGLAVSDILFRLLDYQSLYEIRIQPAINYLLGLIIYSHCCPIKEVTFYMQILLFEKRPEDYRRENIGDS